MCNYPLLYKMNFAITMFDYLFDYLLLCIKNEVCKNPLSMGFSRLFGTGDERIELFFQGAVTPDLWGYTAFVC